MLIGRDREAAHLRAGLGGHHGITVVTGPAGIGKTAIVREVVGDDALWVHGLATAQGRSGDALALVLRAVSGSPERDASQLVRRLGGCRLVLDDAHWLDPYTLAVVELVATTSGPIATWRTDDPSARSSPPRHWTPVGLGPLPPAAACTLARQAGPSLSATELNQVLEVADGSPLLIQELAAGPTLAPSAASALLGRVRGLSTTGRTAVVLVAAAEGGLPEALVDHDARDELRRSGVAVLAGGTWWLRHALLQDSILEVVGPTVVRDAHGTLAHLLAPTDPAAAARHAERAGDHDAALALAEQVISATEDPVAKARAVLALADLHDADRPEASWRLRVDATSELRSHGAYHDVLSALDGRVLPTQDAECYAMASVNLAAALWSLGEHEEAVAIAKRAVEAVQGTDSEAELLLRAGIAMHLTRIQYDGAGALVHARTAFEIARGRDQHVIFVRTRIAAALLAMGDPGWRAEIDGALADAVAAGDQEGERLARESRHVHLFVTGDLDAALEDLEILTDPSQPDGMPPLPRLRAFRLLVELLSLRDRAAIVDAAEQLLAEEAIFNQRTVAVAAGAIAALDHGRADIAHRLLDLDDPVDPEDRLTIRWARAELAWASGQTLVHDADTAPGNPILTVHPAATMTAVVTAWTRLEAGEDIPDEPVLTMAGFAAASTEIEALRCLARSEPLAAVGLFDAAAEVWSAGSDRRAALRARWGAALASESAETPDALERLERSWCEATSVGCAPIAARAGQALRRRGVHKAPVPTAAVPPLSSAQAQTIRLLAAGFTTDQVAALLGLQSGTVTDHLHQAQDRLGLRTRATVLRWIGEQP